jgi:hypothetical protein
MYFKIRNNNGSISHFFSHTYQDSIVYHIFSRKHTKMNALAKQKMYVYLKVS